MLYCAVGYDGVTLMLCKNVFALAMYLTWWLICSFASWMCWSSAMRLSMRVVIIVVCWWCLYLIVNMEHSLSVTGCLIIEYN